MISCLKQNGTKPTGLSNTALIVGLICFFVCLCFGEITSTISANSKVVMLNNIPVVKPYLAGLKMASYDSIQTAIVDLNEEIKAEIIVTEIGPNQKKVNVSFSMKNAIPQDASSCSIDDSFFVFK